MIVVPTSIIRVVHDVTVFSADETFVDYESHRLRGADTICLILYCAFSWVEISEITVIGCHLPESIKISGELCDDNLFIKVASSGFREGSGFAYYEELRLAKRTDQKKSFDRSSSNIRVFSYGRLILG